MIVTIDGPAGAGKSSAARLLAQRLGFDFLDTGGMYRAVAFAAIDAGCDLTDIAAAVALLDCMRIEMPPGRVLLNGADVTQAIRTPAVTARTAAAADNPAVRHRLVGWQRAIAANRDFVTEGRDQGTIVFPEAGCKFFLVADPEERARRRHGELKARGHDIPFAELLQAQHIRDAQDAHRDIAPMVPASDAIILDSTALGRDEVVAVMEGEVRRRMHRQEPVQKGAG